MAVLLDTGLYIALIDPSDAHYQRAPEILKEIKTGIHGQPYTTSFVMAEAATLVAIRTKKNIEAMHVIKSFFVGDARIASLLRPSETTENKAWDLFLKINSNTKKQPVSFVDCLNIIIAEQHHIGVMVTFDNHFESWIHCFQ
ncbi:MAG TPA: PIN domain-containing protein [Candidatus Lokiarchaeia archaeon]|nr:PIN domain-containing protein [Candidatus Lokiarchaeia archaeon]